MSNDDRTTKDKAVHTDVANVMEHVALMVRKGAVRCIKVEWTGGDLSVKMDLRSELDNIQLCLDFNLNKESST